MRRWMALAVLALAALAIGVLFATGVLSSARDEHPPRAQAETPGEAMRVEGSHALQPGGGLQGREGDVAARGVRRGPVTVTVTNLGGFPLAGVPVVLGPAADILTYVRQCRSAVADANGRVGFADVPYDGSMAVALIVSQVGRRDWTDAGVTHPDGMRLARLDARVQTGVYTTGVTRVAGPDVQLETDYGVRYEVRAFDSASGRRLRGLSYHSRHHFLDHTGARCSAPIAAVVPQRYTGLELIRAAVPAGYVPWGDRVRWGAISPMARRLVLTDPLAPAATLVVSFEPGAERPEPGDSRPYVSVGDLSAGFPAGRPDALGRIRIRHLPFRAHAQVSISWVLPGDWLASGTGRFGADPEQPLHISLRLERTDAEDVDIEDEEIVDHIETDNDLPGAEARPAPAQATFRMLRPDGSPAAGAEVIFADQRVTVPRTGRVVFRDVPAGGPLWMRVWGAGIVDEQSFTLEPGTAHSSTVRGHAGGRVRLRVLRPDGTPLRFAGFHAYADGWWTDVRGDVQRGDRLVDAQGQRILHQLPPGPLQIRAFYAGVAVDGKVRVVRGKTVDATITIDLGRD